MAKLVYTSIMSLDGCIEDEHGRFDWAVPDDEVHAFINNLERSLGTYLYGRRTFETMAGWETPFVEVWPRPRGRRHPPAVSEPIPQGTL